MVRNGQMVKLGEGVTMCRNDRRGKPMMVSKKSILQREYRQDQCSLEGGVTMSGMRGYRKAVRGGTMVRYLPRLVGQNGQVSTLPGPGQPVRRMAYGVAAAFNGPVGIAVDSHGNLYVADQGNNLIRMVAQVTLKIDPSRLLRLQAIDRARHRGPESPGSRSSLQSPQE